MKQRISITVTLICTFLVILAGCTIFENKQYSFISLALAIISCVPFFISFEKNKRNSAKITIIAVMTALSVLSRIIFSALPGFKPVTAMVVITAMYFGCESGFMVGALTAVISNLYFGQGPWTPFQMLAWGLVGLAAGIISRYLKKSFILLALYGALSGAVFSFVMDIWTVVWIDGYFNFPRYIAAISSSASFTLIYAVSNAVFLCILARPIVSKLERIRNKYGI